MFKSILAVSEGGPDATMAFRLAGEIGGLFGAAVEAVHYPTTISSVADGLVGGTSGVVIAWDGKRMEARAATSKAAYDAELAQKPNCSFTSAERQDLDDMLMRARTNDLLVVGRPGADADNPAPQTVSQALHESACPVMIAPPSGTMGEPREIVIAWNGSEQAARAIRFALPLLKMAKAVTIVVVGADRKPIGTERVKQWLGRHGLATDLASIDPGAGSARARGRALLSFTHERGASALVMGAYGRGAVMELLGLGGATAKVITACRVPVLMAH